MKSLKNEEINNLSTSQDKKANKLLKGMGRGSDRYLFLILFLVILIIIGATYYYGTILNRSIVPFVGQVQAQSFQPAESKKKVNGKPCVMIMERLS